LDENAKVMLSLEGFWLQVFVYHPEDSLPPIEESGTYKLEGVFLVLSRL
jgi:hypothetical protein